MNFIIEFLGLSVFIAVITTSTATYEQTVEGVSSLKQTMD
jgi:hypothetical protein